MSFTDRAERISRDWQELLRSSRAIAIIRSPNLQLGKAMALAVATGGMRLIEIAWNSTDADILINQLRTELPYCTIGAGTILNKTDLQNAIASGSQFIFSPHCDRDLVRLSIDSYQIPIVPGALSPTEILNARNAGASAVKIFPVAAVGGFAYIKHLSGPLGQIPLIPTGGVTIDNAREYIRAGAIAVGLSTQLFPPPLVAQGDWEAISARVKLLLDRL